jgi:hypothetical protein
MKKQLSKNFFIIFFILDEKIFSNDSFNLKKFIYIIINEFRMSFTVA